MSRQNLSERAKELLRGLHAGSRRAATQVVWRLQQMHPRCLWTPRQRSPKPEHDPLWSDAQLRACLQAHLELIQMEDRLKLIETTVETMMALRRRSAHAGGADATQPGADTTY